jgi:rhodanese-related sulfurtransferase
VTGWLVLPARAALLLAAGAAAGIVVNAARRDGVRLSGFSTPTVCAATAAASAPEAAVVEVLPPVAAARLCQDPSAVIVDVRSDAAFAAGHVAGAIHLPCLSSGAAASAAVDLLGGKRTLIIYGDGAGGGDARPVADELARRAGRPGLRVVVIDGGFTAWSQAGMACSSGPSGRGDRGPAARPRRRPAPGRAAPPGR